MIPLQRRAMLTKMSSNTQLQRLLSGIADYQPEIDTEIVKEMMLAETFRYVMPVPCRLG